MRHLRMSVVLVTVLAGSSPLLPAGAVTAGTWTRISSPASPGQRVFAYADIAISNMAVSGTVSNDLVPGTDTLDFYCFTDNDAQGNNKLNASPVAIQANHGFSATITRPGAACVLRAVPSTYTQIDGAGHNSGYVGAFAGPSYYYGWFSDSPQGGYLAGSGTRGRVVEYPVGDLGLWLVAPMDDGSKSSVHLADILNLRLGGDNVTTGSPTGTAIRVDGHFAYTPYSLFGIASSAGDVPVAAFTRHHHADGTFVATETDPLRWCAGNAYPQPSAGCQVRQTGTELVRTVTARGGDSSAVVKDRFISTDGRKHTVSAEYYNQLTGESSGMLGWRPPGRSAFSSPPAGATVTGIPVGVQTLFSTNDMRSAEGGFDHVVQGLTWSARPSVHVGTAAPNYAFFGARYSRVLTAKLPAAASFIVDTGFTMQAVRGMAATSRRQLTPRLHITAPARSTADHTPTVKGRLVNATNGLPATLKVVIGGTVRTVAVSSAGRFSITWPRLASGKHTIKVTGTDPGGLKVSASRTFTVT